ncbi:HBL/NHE enterotoxin family protein [Streptomyces sp. NPDC058000]|uniref:HBL/NHE enterotoxin family protein n=1 Tax=Streptomyces sp. NPDC058000 TaxID=3346299 RepID=UPI0036E28A21
MQSALLGSHAPALAVQSLIECIELVYPLQFADLKDLPQVRTELEKLDPSVADEAVTALSGIASHTRTAQQHGQFWRNRLLQLFQSTASDVRGYAELFGVAADEVNRQLKAAGSDPGRQRKALSDARDQLSILRDDVSDSREEPARNLRTDLTNFAVLVNGDSAAFGTDRQTVEKAITGQGGIIEKLKGCLDALGRQLTDDLAKIAQGAIEVGEGIVLIVIGGIFTVADEPDAGIGFINAGIGRLKDHRGHTVSDVDLNKEKSELLNLQQGLSVLQASIASFSTAQQAVATFADSNHSSVTGADGLIGMWDAHAEALDAQMKAIDDPHADPAQLVKDVSTFFDTALADWQAGQKTAKFILDGLGGIQDNVDITRVDRQGAA